MTKNIYLIYLLILFSFMSCSKKENIINNMSDVDFIALISNNSNSINGISKIDSLIDNTTFSNHRLAIAYYHKAKYLLISRNYIESVAYSNKSLSLFKGEDNQLYIGRAYNLLANNNINLNKEEEALREINIALSIFKNLKNKDEEVVVFDALARLYYRNGNYSKALEILKKSLALYIALDYDLRAFSTYGNIGSIYYKIKDYKNAIFFYKKAIKLNDENNFLNSNPLQDLGLIYLENNEPEKCIDLHMISLKIQNKTGHLAIQKQIYDVLLDSIKGKNLKSSNIVANYFNKLPSYIIKRDSVIQLMEKAKVETRIKSIESQYKLQIKTNELNQEIELNKQNKWFYIISLISLLFITLFLLQKYRNRQLKLRQEKLILEQKVLRSQMNPHFIFNALTSIQRNLLDEDLLKSSTSLARFAKLIRQNFEFTNKDLISLDEDLEALKNYIETQQLRFEDKFDYEINVQKELDLSYIQIPPMLLQPFVENAIEHGFRSKEKKGNLTINVLKSSDLFKFEIIDDGIGIIAKVGDSKREHAIDIFLNRLKLRRFSEEKSFKITSNENGEGTKISFLLKL